MSTVSQLRGALEAMFSGCCESAAKESGVIRRKRVFTASSLARTFILGLFENPNASAEELAAMAARCDAPVTKQAIEKRYTLPTVRFFELLFQRSTQLIVKSQESLAPILERFAGVIIADSSTISLPDSEADKYKGRGGSHGGGKAAVKVQTELNLKSGKLECVEVTPGCASDVACSGQHRAHRRGTLRITDLGYFSAAVFTRLALIGCYFLSRLHRTMYVAIDGIDQGNVIDYLIAQKQTLIDQWVVVGTKEKLDCRLIAWKVPAQMSERRRRKVRADYKNRGRGMPPAKALAACDWTMLVTNLPVEKLSVKEAVVLYRARWQIELLFKRWKSIGRAIAGSKRTDTVEMVRLWAKLCAMLIQHWLCVACCYGQRVPLSFFRVAKLTSKLSGQMAAALASGESTRSNALEAIIAQFQVMTFKSARRDKRAKDFGAIELLQNPEKLEWCLS